MSDYAPLSSTQLTDYLDRIGLKEALPPSLNALNTIQFAHRSTIPWECLDVRLGRAISLAPLDVFNKLIRRKRGGYCFEQNTLFGGVLASLGFEARPLLGRVWLRMSLDDPTPPNTHLLHLVTIDGAEWTGDVGFGGGYNPPIRLIDGETVKGKDGVEHRLTRHDVHGWLLERKTKTGYAPQFSFTTNHVEQADIEMCNHWTATHADSRFVNNSIATIVLPQGMAMLLNGDFSRQMRDETLHNELISTRMVRSRLEQVFGIELSLEEVEALDIF